MMTNRLWKDWELIDWILAKYCPVCGLPMMELSEEEQTGSRQEIIINNKVYQCVYCTWISDDAR